MPVNDLRFWLDLEDDLDEGQQSAKWVLICGRKAYATCGGRIPGRDIERMGSRSVGGLRPRRLSYRLPADLI